MLILVAILFGLAKSLHVEIMVASAWQSFDRRQHLRKAFSACHTGVDSATVSHHFFMGEFPEQVGEGSDARAQELESYIQEAKTHDDVVLLGGPDTDPGVERDITYFLPRPTSRAYRVAFGSRWILKHVPNFDYVFYLDDDSFLNVPLLFKFLFYEQERFHSRVEDDRKTEEAKRKVDFPGVYPYNPADHDQLDHGYYDGIIGSVFPTDDFSVASLRPSEGEIKYAGERIEKLAMGWNMLTELRHHDVPICKICTPNCESCMRDEALTDFCEQPALKGLVSLGGCLFYIQTCRIYTSDEERMVKCILDSYREERKMSDYFGSTETPRWMLGMGWMFGREIVKYIGRNAHILKKRGAADVILGYWLVQIEDVHWVDMAVGPQRRMHDYPTGGNTFAAACTRESLLVHRMNDERWTGFNETSCEMTCDMG